MSCMNLYFYFITFSFSTYTLTISQNRQELKLHIIYNYEHDFDANEQIVGLNLHFGGQVSDHMHGNSLKSLEVSFRYCLNLMYS